jgi:hypothetical protein
MHQASPTRVAQRFLTAASDPWKGYLDTQLREAEVDLSMSDVKWSGKVEVTAPDGSRVSAPKEGKIPIGFYIYLPGEPSERELLRELKRRERNIDISLSDREQETLFSKVPVNGEQWGDDYEVQARAGLSGSASITKVTKAKKDQHGDWMIEVVGFVPAEVELELENY